MGGGSLISVKKQPSINAAVPSYNSMTRNTKQYLEKAGADHFCFNSEDATACLKGVSWMKRFVDGDTRYTSLACGNPTASGYSNFRTANCN